jgi:aryl-alcohol dehydrogenase-like predicted oxidoreductase
VKLALGTAQFGLPYGIANQSGQVRREEVGKILALARESSIDTLDTAIAYGDSEHCLGEMGTQGFKVVTKLPDMPAGVENIGAWVNDQVRNSLIRLKVESIYGLLMHRSENLLGAAAEPTLRVVERLKADGVVQKFGVSIYAPHELEAVTESGVIDLVQAPFSIIDRRLVMTGWLQRLHDQGVEVHARSIFLQGLLLMSSKAMPGKFKPWFDLFDHWYAWLQENHVGAAEACLAFVTSQTLIDRVVVGVESRAQLQELIRAGAKASLTRFPELFCEDEKLINPSNWKLL